MISPSVAGPADIVDQSHALGPIQAYLDEPVMDVEMPAIVITTAPQRLQCFGLVEVAALALQQERPAIQTMTVIITLSGVVERALDALGLEPPDLPMLVGELPLGLAP